MGIFEFCPALDRPECSQRLGALSRARWSAGFPKPPHPGRTRARAARSRQLAQFDRRRNIADGKDHLNAARNVGLLINREALPQLAWMEYLSGNTERAISLLGTAAESQDGQGRGLEPLLPWGDPESFGALRRGIEESGSSVGRNTRSRSRSRGTGRIALAARPQAGSGFSLERCGRRRSNSGKLYACRRRRRFRQYRSCEVLRSASRADKSRRPIFPVDGRLEIAEPRDERSS